MEIVKDIMTLKELAEYTGYSKSGLYRLVQCRKIPHSKPGGKKIFFLRSDVQQWIMSGKQEVK